MNDNLNEEFDPRKFTAKELLKQLLIKQEETANDVLDLAKKVTKLELDLQKRNILSDEKEKRRTGLWLVVGAVGGIIVMIIDAIFKYITK